MTFTHTPRREPELVTVRRITRQECPWLDADIDEGTRVFAYWGNTYGCISDTGIAVTMKRGETPFMEVPKDAVQKM